MTTEEEEILPPAEESVAQARATAFIERLKEHRSTNDFAYEYDRNEAGWIQFPRDIEARRRLFGTGVMPHPAKMQLMLVASLVEYLTEPGEVVLDPFGGTGSTALASYMGRNTIMFEIEDTFCDIMKEALHELLPVSMTIPFGEEKWLAPYQTWSLIPMDPKLGYVQVWNDDNREAARHLAQMSGPSVTAVITSPPYSTALKNAGRLQASMMDTYKGSIHNMGNLNPFLWERAMNELFKGLFDCLKPGGRVAMVNKDMMKSGGRELLSLGLNRGAAMAGFKFQEWFKWATPGTQRTLAMKAKGGEAVLDEDVIIYRKPL